VSALCGLLTLELLSAVAIALFDAIFLGIVLAVLAPTVTVAGFKGRWILLAAGFIGLVSFGLGSLLWLWGACRLARPRSAWAKAFYGPDKFEKARRRYWPKPVQGPRANPARTRTAGPGYPTINVYIDARSVHVHGRGVPAHNRSAKPGSGVVKGTGIPNPTMSRHRNRSEPI